jgi:hypothetical protein
MRTEAGMRQRVPASAVLALVLAALTGCAAPAASESAVTAPPAGAAFDYQLGAAYPPPDGVDVVARDRTAPAADGVYSVCYLNAFQTQPGELDVWPENTLLRADGEPVIDPDWPDEVILDTSTETARTTIVGIVSGWIEQCAHDGYSAVEFDNLDTFTRTDGALTLEDNLAVARELVAASHRAGLAAGQKNAAEYTHELHDAAGFDFAVAEECAAFDECDAYADVYGAHVLAIEYVDALPRPFADVCADAATPRSTILRDRDLVAAGQPGYVYERC